MKLKVHKYDSYGYFNPAAGCYYPWDRYDVMLIVRFTY